MAKLRWNVECFGCFSVEQKLTNAYGMAQLAHFQELSVFLISLLLIIALSPPEATKPIVMT
jgi:hypothetical protein